MISFTILPYLETSKLKCTVQQYLVFPGFFEEINQNGYSYKSKSFKLYEVINVSPLLKKNRFWGELWLERVTVSWSEIISETRQTSAIELKAVTYLGKKLHNVWQTSKHTSDNDCF